MEKLIEVLKTSIPKDELTAIAYRLNLGYYAYMFDEQVWQLLFNLFPQELNPYIRDLQNVYVGHDVVNEILMKLYPGERMVKYHLVKSFLGNKDEVALFEMRIQNSRLDVGRVNGCSYAYEIKTELDSLLKLAKQVSDYSLVFEYVIIALHSRHLNKAKDFLPEYCGIEAYEINDGKITFDAVRKPSLSPILDAEAQVDSLTSKDLEFILRANTGKNIPSTRKEREKLITDFRENEINYFFKLAVKNRYKERWEYLSRCFDKINPIDIQELYTGPIEPKNIYYKNSSIV